MSSRVTLDVPLNRVEGDLEIRVELEDGVVRDAFCSGTMFRGFEKILQGRGPLDGLVITPRICGICSTSHLLAAVKALDAISGAKPPADALRLRNVAVGCEHVQSDVRHSFLIFAADFASPAHRRSPLYDEAVRRYAPYQGETVVETVRETKRLLEVVALIGGQWPHSTFMVPGGIASVPSGVDRAQARLIVRKFRRWYESRVLGCPVERLAEVSSRQGLEAWLEEGEAHRESELGFFLRYGRQIGLETLGQAHDRYLSFGSLDLPGGTKVTGRGRGEHLYPAALVEGGRPTSFDQELVTEDVTSSWYEVSGGDGHPSRGETRPYASGRESGKYSWAKAPRYQGRPAETGPLAEALASGHPLFADLAREGGNASVRQLARLLRPVELLPAIELWLDEVRDDSKLYCSPDPIVEGEGHGITHASRGALGHWVRIEDGAIAHYQIITPTAWNASPRDGAGLRGPMEEALVGTRISVADDPVELGHVVRSFDPCLVCSVHALGPGGRSLGRVRIGS